MAGSITLALRTVQSGLLTNQAALDTVANNVANVNTPGYSRKIVQLETRVLTGTGSGVQIAEITRKIDDGLLKSLRLALSVYNELDIQTDYHARVQELFRPPADNTSLSHFLSEFTNAIESLSVTPEGTLEQSEMVRWATEVTEKLQAMTSTLQELRQQADKEIADNVTVINNLIVGIADLNDKIIRNGSVGLDTSDLRDSRDNQIDALSELIDIRYFVRGDGDVVIFTSGGRTLVDNVSATLSHNFASMVAATTTHAGGNFDGIFVGAKRSENDITTELRGGKLKGLVTIRDDVLPGLQSQIDELAAELQSSVNLIHNRGLSFPGAQEMTGTRALIQPGTSTIAFGGTTDSRIVLFDNSGSQIATTTVRALLGGASGTVNATATAIQNWVQANSTATTASVSAATGKLVIDLNSSAVNIAFRDEESVNTLGATAQDATINWDYNADGTTDESMSGFANFFGLNDFFVDNLAENIHESNVVVGAFSSSAATLRFHDSSGQLAGSPLAIASGSSLEDIRDAINNGITGVTASVIPDGPGYRLRVARNSGVDLVVTQAAGNTLLTDLGMHRADVRLASAIAVRADIVSQPSRMTRGAAQWEPNLGLAGQYRNGPGDDTTIKALTETMTTPNAFDQAGGLAALTTRFDQYAAAIIARSSSLASANLVEHEFNEGLSDSLRQKSDNVRGVNLDEEMSNLILFEQAYAAAARVITVIQNMFDSLFDSVR